MSTEELVSIDRVAFAYAQGGMLLEAAIGGQKFKFKPLDQEEQEDAGEEDAKSAKGAKDVNNPLRKTTD